MKILLLGIFSIIVAQNLYSQDFYATIKFADSLKKYGFLDESLKYYQRAWFFADSANDDYLALQIAEINYSIGNYANAIKFFSLYQNSSTNDSVYNDLAFKKATAYIFIKSYNYALIEIFSIKSENNHLLEQRKDFYKGVCYFLLENYALSEKHFILSLDTSEIIKTNKLKETFSNRKNFDYPKGNTAWYLSLCIPGLGQLYSGDYRNALNSFVLNTLLLGLTVQIGLTYHPIDAIMAVAPWFIRYYQGGAAHAEKIALEKQNHRKTKTYKSIMDLLQN